MSEEAGAVRAVLRALIAAALRDDDPANPFLEEARRHHGGLPSTLDLTPDRLDGLFAMAVREAEAPAARTEERRVSMTLPVRCPLRLDDLGAGFDAAALANRIRTSAGTG